MKIAIGADHAGFSLKAALVQFLTQQGHSVTDVGTDNPDEPKDYSDYAEAVARLVVDGSVERGIVVCGSGVGACIAANKISGIYAGLCHDTYSAHQGVEHDNMNVLCLGSRIIGPALAEELVAAFLSARFQEQVARYVRRHSKVRALEDTPPRT
ncbi:MAG: ribose 5-phosphate isomerase B [Anaerolineae bacterium]|nr:ribose 5-phosphate isomerase B [Anaerolineae bacterium]MEB2286771.1 ribose 5-phosphate isomerase B [Anaerolineae bacterium]